MIFKEKKAYFVKSHTRNKTNTKSYDLLNGDFIFEATFKFEFNEDMAQNEFCVLGRTGYNMGIFAQGKDAVKWCWFEDDDGTEKYQDIFVYPIDNSVKCTIKVVKKDNFFHLYYNDKLYGSKEIKGLMDYSNQTIFVGVANPYSDYTSNFYWFNGEIYDIKIYHSSIEDFDNIYLWYDFENNTHFKTLDISGNGNHGEIYETEELKHKINIEFNKTARPAKII